MDETHDRYVDGLIARSRRLLEGGSATADTLAENVSLREQLRHAEAEIERLRAERDDLEKRAAALGKDAIKLDDLRLSALRQAEAERDRARELAVWVASKVDCDVLPSNNGRKTVRLESFALGVRVIPTDGTDAGILAALEKTMGNE